MGQSKTESPAQSLAKIMDERKEKADALSELGHNPYRNDFSPSTTIAALRKRYEGTLPEGDRPPGITPVDGENVRVAGRVVAKRGFGKTVFAPIRGTEADIQLFISIDHLDPNDFENVKPKLDAGDIVGAEGPVFWTKRGEMSVLVKRLFILTKSLRPLPDKWHGLTNVETRYRQRYLDLAVSPEVKTIFRKRSHMIREMRNYLDERGFLEVETPMMHPIIGGAAARPFATHHNALDMPLYMRIAPELYLKRLLVGGLERVYEINRNFRNEGLSRRHNPEFTMLEFYQAYATYEDLMDLTEDMVGSLAMSVNGTTDVTWEGNDIKLAAPWKRLSVHDAVTTVGEVPAKNLETLAQATKACLAAKLDPMSLWLALIGDLPTEVADSIVSDPANIRSELKDNPDKIVEGIASNCGDVAQRVRLGHLIYLLFEVVAEEKLIQPTFLTDFPVAVSPLARKKDADPAYVDRFELFIGGKEIANAFSELNDPIDQRQRFKAQVEAKSHGAEETMDYDEDYCRALEVGMPPAAGEGIGIDRLAMVLTGQDSIRDVILFPLMRPE